MKKCLTIMLALCLLLGTLPAASAMGGGEPTSGSCGPDAAYALENGVLTISGTGPVTWNPWYFPYPSGDWRGEINSVLIEDGITELCPSVFFGCVNLTAANIPDSVTYIGQYAFSSTPWLEAQTDEFVIVGNGILIAYNGSSSAVTIPDTVRSIAGGTFQRAEITSVTVGGSVEHIGTYAFASCPKLEQVSIAGTISTIEGNILSDTPWLAAQTDEFVIVGDGVLLAYNGPGVVVTIPDTVHMIPEGVLWFTDTPRQIVEITIPATVAEIKPGAFEGGGYDGFAPPVVIHGALGSAAETYALSGSWMNSYRFVPFGQEDGSLFNFLKETTFTDNTFADVKADKWYRDSVATVYELWLMKGQAYNTFAPNGDIKLSEAITVADRVRDTYYYEQTDFNTEGIWYRPYVDYALEHGIIEAELDNYNRPATRAEFAAMLAAALPACELESADDEIDFTDVDEDHSAYAAIMTLARAGIMQGKGDGVFDPDTPVLRSEAAAMLSRCVKPELRIREE